MSTYDDFPGDMEAFPFDERESDAVFGAPGADVPDSLRDVADLVQAARRPGSADELAGGDELVAGIAAAIGEHAAPLPSVADERIRVLNKVRTAKAAAAATVVLMLGGTAAAAATGTLPAPVTHHHAALTSAEMSTGPSGPTGATGATGATGHHGKHHGLSGTVASVNGSTDPSACGTGDTGMFTLTGHHGETFTVNVVPATTYFSKHVTDASFANVCVGSRVKVKGMVDGTTVAADKVRIKKTETADHHEHEGTGALALPPLQPAHEQHDGVKGSVVSVNGSTDPAACGSGDTGSFTVTDHDGNTFTVNVSPTTTFGHGHGHDDGDDDDQASAPAQSFADVCVGTKVGAKGAVTDTTVAADMVFVRGDHKGDHEGDHEADDAAENHDTASAEHDGEGHQAATSGQDSGGDHHDGSSHDGSGDQASSDHGSGHDD